MRYQEVVKQLLHGHGYVVDASEEQWQTILYDFARAIKPGIEEMVKRQEGEITNFDASKYDAMNPGPVWLQGTQQQAQALQKPVEQPRLSDIPPLYENRLRTKEPKTRSTRLHRWGRLVDFCRDKYLSDFATKDLTSFFQKPLKRVPRRLLVDEHMQESQTGIHCRL